MAIDQALEKQALEDQTPEDQTPEPDTASDGGETRRPQQCRQEKIAPGQGWIKLILRPLLFLAAGVLLIVALGAAQKIGWISAGGGGGRQLASSGDENVRYICPMMCTPPQTEPGRCPVCAMELVPANSGGGSDGLSIQVDPAARRVANIRTVAVKAVSLTRKIRTIGELSYDEGTLKTIAAYVDGRLDRLYADYTGVVVENSDRLALLYSPKLYSSQVELLVAKRARRQNRSTMVPGGTYSGRDLYDSALERLIEFGMTASQIEKLEEAGEANSRIYLCAPINGTVIEKLAVEGQYVKTGQPIYRLADLSTIWLMLEMFPEDAASIRYGQKVEAEVQSLPGRKFSGRVAFIDPTVDCKTRTVGVRVIMPNEDGLLRIGDYAKATIDANLGIHTLVVPRNAVLMAGRNSVIYVETDPGRFEIRRVVLGPSSGDTIAILEGVKEGEQVACSGNFLIDSQMQLAGNPSLIDPMKAIAGSEPDEAESAELIAAFSKLSADDRALAQSQRICPVTKLLLGSMGAPPKVDVNGTAVFICCEGCRESLLEEPHKYLAELAELSAAADSPRDVSRTDDTHTDIPPIGAMQMLEPQLEFPQMQAPPANADEVKAIEEALAKLSPADRDLAKRQKVCPVTDMPLGSMGAPIKMSVNGRPVFICCEGCRGPLLAEPVKHLAKLPREAVR